MTSTLARSETELLAHLEDRLSPFSKVVVAFSGGADSALLAFVATRLLGRQRVLCVTAVSPSLAPEEELDTRTLASEWDLRYQAVRTDELANPDYVANGLDRCYHCKVELMDHLVPIAEQEKAMIVLGVNVDDLGDHRPGQLAATERGARFPFVEANLTKQEVRSLSRHLGLRTWDKPAAACLASRIPHGSVVTIKTLSQVAQAESAMKKLGFSQLRVRHYDELARIELHPSEFAHAIEKRSTIVEALTSVGFRYVTLDLEGFSSGNLARRARQRAQRRIMNIRVRLVFPNQLVREPILARLVRGFDVEPNIRRADVEEDSGWIICELQGEPTALDAAINWLADTGVRVELLGDVIEG